MKSHDPVGERTQVHVAIEEEELVPVLECLARLRLCKVLEVAILILSVPCARELVVLVGFDKVGRRPTTYSTTVIRSTIRGSQLITEYVI